MIAKIIIASTLKPVWDPRAYEKIGKSLAATGNYSVEIIGSGKTIPDDPSIKFHNHQITRSFLSRLLVQFKVLRQLLRIRPDLLIIGTHELIIPAVIFKLLTRKKLIYDIRENYNYNLRYQEIYPFFLRQLMALYVRTKEVIFQNSFNYFFSAEQCYLTEINFLAKHRTKVLVLENKTIKKTKLVERDENSPIELLISGTISESYGVFDAITFFKQLPVDRYTLKIIGHCPSYNVKKSITKLVADCSNINLELSDNPILHDRILESYTTRTIGLLPYLPNKSTENKVPTKLFEYAAYGIPILISENKTWCRFVKEHNCGLCINFQERPNINQISKCFSLKEQFLSTDQQAFMWNNYEPELLNALETVLRN